MSKAKGEKGPDLYVLLRAEPPTRCGDTSFYHIVGSIVTQEQEHGEPVPHGVDSWGKHAGYQHLKITCQGEAGSARPQPYGWEVRYEDVFSIDLGEAETHFKTLKAIRTGLNKVERTFGRPTTYAEFVLRVARVIGAKGFVVRSEREQYQGTWRWITPSEAQYWIEGRQRLYTNQGLSAEQILEKQRVQ